MDRRGAFSVSLVCLLIALAVASDPAPRQNPETRTRRNTVSGSSEQESKLGAEPAVVRGTDATSTSSNVLAEDAISRGHPPRSRGDRERIEEQKDEDEEEDEDENEDEEEEEDYEGEEENEERYEAELKVVAESHEAMSRDDTRNSNVSTAAAGSVLDRASSAAKNFDSHEVITVNDSDEDVASNEAITDEILDTDDQKVAELLKYKKERNSKESRAKTKRVPTVKKELSTQREVLLASNETQQSLVQNGLNEETETIRRRNTGSNGSTKPEDTKHSVRSSSDDESATDDRYEGAKPKKLNKRREMDPKHLANLKNWAIKQRIDEEQRQLKLRELGAEEEALALDRVLKHLVKLTNILSRMERMQSLIKIVENELKVVSDKIEEGHEPKVEVFTTPESLVDSGKPRKKSKKKKIKKPKQSFYDRPTVSEPYHRLRYDQLSPASRDFLRGQEEDYQSELDVAAEYEVPGREVPLSKSWPDVPYEYGPAWKMEGRPLLPETWPWRSQTDPKYWPQRAKFIPVEKKYRSTLNDEEDAEPEADLEKIWQQQRVQHTWDRDRLARPAEKPPKVSPPWQQNERSMKQYDRDRSNVAWEKNKNRSELNKSSTKQEAKDKVALPQITMKTWNSLTSDPATWPQKIPGAKPWPKDENGKSYNPNADLVKKLGLDKQSSGAWSKEDSEKSNAERKSKEEKQSRLVSSKESSKEEEFPRTEASKYEPNSDRSNFSESVKPWTVLTESKASKDWSKSENVQIDDDRTWKSKNPWSSEAGLPKIQSVGAWVMAADQSMWKPYEMKPIEPSEDVSRRWIKPISRPDPKWSSKRTWTDKVNDSWMDESNVWPEKMDSWLEKPGKPGSWFSKSKDDPWTPKSGNSDPWKVKGDWLIKPESSWTSKMGDNNSWVTKSGPWSTKSNESWPSKWKQFAYHRVTAMPISKPGTTADAAASKVKNAFVAVSAVSSPKYSGNEWRKDEESRNEKEDQERTNNQLQRPIYAWKKDPGVWSSSSTRANASDSLENQLEALRQIDFWSNYKDEQKRSTSTNATSETTSAAATNGTSTTTHRRGGDPGTEGKNLLKTNRRTISMK